MLEARWLAMPTPATGPPSARAARGDRQHGVGHGGRVELHQSGGRGVGQDRGVVLVLDRGIGAHDGGADARGADVDDEDAAARVAAHVQGAGPKGEGSPNLPGLRMPTGSKVCLEPAQDLEARAEGPGQEAGAVQPDAVVMADGGAVGQGGVGHGVPGLAVVALAPLGRRPRDRARRR